jgi:hypothetical protein
MKHIALYTTLLTLIYPLPTQAGLGQGTLDYGLRQSRIQNKMYSGNSFFKDSNKTTNQKKLNYKFSGSNARVSQFSRNLNSQTQTSRYQTKVVEQKRSFWDRFKSDKNKKTYETQKYTYDQRFQKPGLSFGGRNHFSDFNSTVRLQNPEKDTKRVSSGDINKFIDPRATERDRGQSGFIEVQGPVKVIPLRR